MKYLRFKQEFEKHVKYEGDEEKMLALKTKCLTKSYDKQRVANEVSLSDCWDKLNSKLVLASQCKNVIKKLGMIGSRLERA